MIIKIQFLELILLLNNEAAITLTFDIPLQNKILEIRKKRKKKSYPNVKFVCRYYVCTECILAKYYAPPIVDSSLVDSVAAYRAGGLSEREVGVQTPNFWNNNFSHRHGGRFANRITPRSKGQRDSILSVSKFCRSVDYYYYSKQDGICNGPGIGMGGLFSLKKKLTFLPTMYLCRFNVHNR